jgi:ferritin
MKGNAKVLKELNHALQEELTAINQYFLHAEMNENCGYKRLADYIKKQSIDEMKHAEVRITSSIGSSGKMYTFGVGEGQERQSTMSSFSDVSQVTQPVVQPVTQSSGSSIGAWTDQNPMVRHDGLLYLGWTKMALPKV